jgi:hypothetical protein
MSIILLTQIKFQNVKENIEIVRINLPSKNNCYIYSDKKNESEDAYYKIISLGFNIKFNKYSDTYYRYEPQVYQSSYYQFFKDHWGQTYTLSKEDCPADNKQFSSKRSAINNIRLAIIDTGINLKERSDLKSFIKKKLRFSDNDTKYKDAPYHATIVADIISNFLSNNKKVENLEYGVELYDYKIFCEKSKLDPLLAELDAYAQVLEDKIQIVNYSVSGEKSIDLEYRFLKRLETQGVIVVVAAGNTGKNLKSTPQFPCSYPKLSNVICVGALDPKSDIEGSNIRISDVSSFGDDVSVYAKSLDGSTSYAVPFVSKMLVAIWKRHPKFNYKEVIKMLPIKNIATDKKKIIPVLDENEFLNNI